MAQTFLDKLTSRFSSQILTLSLVTEFTMSTREMYDLQFIVSIKKFKCEMLTQNVSPIEYSNSFLEWSIELELKTPNYLLSTVRNSEPFLTHII